LLVLANKKDESGALSGAVVGEALVLQELCLGESLVVEVSAAPGREESDPNLERGVEWLLDTVQLRYEELQTRIETATIASQQREAARRLERERTVLRKKIAGAAYEQLDPALRLQFEAAREEDMFTQQEAIEFLAAEIGVTADSLEPIAVGLCELCGLQRLALQIIGGLFCPVNKKKVPMSWIDIRALILDIRLELGLLA
jgi:hypothetical protein